MNVRSRWMSRQSARLLLQSSELGPPIPVPAGERCPSLWFRGGGSLSLAGERGGRTKFGRGDIHSGTLGIS